MNYIQTIWNMLISIKCVCKQIRPYSERTGKLKHITVILLDIINMPSVLFSNLNYALCV